MTKLEQRLERLERAINPKREWTPPPPNLIKIAMHAMIEEDARREGVPVEEIIARTRDTSLSGPRGETWAEVMAGIAATEGCSVDEVQKDFEHLVRKGLALAARNRSGALVDDSAKNT